MILLSAINNMIKHHIKYYHKNKYYDDQAKYDMIKHNK